MDAIQVDIDKLNTEIEAMKKKINDCSGGKDEYNTKRAELRAQLDHWSAKMDDASKRKESITGKRQEDKEASIQAKNDLKKMKKSIGYESEGQIDDRIASIEF